MRYTLHLSFALLAMFVYLPLQFMLGLQFAGAQGLERHHAPFKKGTPRTR